MRRPFKTRRSKIAALGAAALLIALAFPATSFADNASGCDFAANGTTESCLPPLSGSTFAGADGNLKTSPTTFGTTDWQNVAGLHTGVDDPSGSGDNAFGQGTKEDNAAVTVVNGSIPPNKSDLTRFYEADETVGSGASAQVFLYLAWERSNVLGNANMDFEINQQQTDGFTGATTGHITINRQPGDLLVTYDFTNGGGRPTIGLNQWLVSATNPVVPGFATNTCLSSNSFPCWGDHVNLTGSISEGAVNNLDAVTDPIGGTTQAVNTFGETAINLTGAGIFAPGVCKAFGSAFLKSRASSSFTAEVKDFVAPVPINISNCGTVTIIKHTDPRGVDQSFSFDSNVTGKTAAGGSTACPTGTNAFTLNDKGNTTGDSTGNTKNCFDVPVGSYTVTEGAEPTGFVLESLTGEDLENAGGSCTQHAADSPQADIVVTADSHVVCTYTNKQQLGAIKITKTSSKGTNPGLAGAKFSITSGGTAITGSPFTTDANGEICVDNLPFGDYKVKETQAPTGYVIDDATEHTVTVDNNATCADATYVGEAIGFTDTPVSDIQVNFRDGGSGATSATISCNNSTGTSDTTTKATGWDKTLTVTGVEAPTTITCTIAIDP